MEYQLKHRLTGAVIIILAGVFMIPMILQEPVTPLVSKPRFQPEGSQSIPKSNDESDGGGLVAHSPDRNKPALVSASPSMESSSNDGAGQENAEALVMTRKIEPAAGSALTFDDDAVTGWTVRVGTYADADNEARIIRKLDEHKLKPKRTRVTTGVGAATRVWLGPYSSQSKAEAVALSLKNITGQEGYVPKP